MKPGKEFDMLLQKLIAVVVSLLENWCERRGRYRLITGRKADDELYLVRYFLFSSRWFSIYIHRFMRSDDPTPHDHPFSFAGYVVSGGYEEKVWDFNGLRMLGKNFPRWFPIPANHAKVYSNIRKAGSLAWRPSWWAHVVEIDRTYKWGERKLAPCTVIFRGPYTQDWGFYASEYQHNSTKPIYRWTPWRCYLDFDQVVGIQKNHPLRKYKE